MTIHTIRHKLDAINKHLLFIRELSAQSGVIQEVDRVILDVCNLGDSLDEDSLDKI